MADVYLVVSQGLDGFRKLLVMKRMKPGLAEDPELLRLFFNEARLSARLNHPNVVQVYDVKVFYDCPVLIMDYLDGIPFHDLRRSAIREKAWDPAIGLAVLSEALAGLHYAHELTDYDGAALGLVHRDFTPKNIFVTYDGYVKVLDFGIAKALTSSTQTKTGGFRGTIRYMAPESFRRTAIDRRADIYAAGVMLWESLTGRRMWQGVEDVEVIKNVADGKTPPLTDVLGVTNDLEEVYRKAVARDPSQRFETAQAFPRCARQLPKAWSQLGEHPVRCRAQRPAVRRTSGGDQVAHQPAVDPIEKHAGRSGKPGKESGPAGDSDAA